MHPFRCVFPVLLSMLPYYAHAHWTGKGGAGLVIARGNTNTNTANATLDLANELEKWKHAFGLVGIYTSNSDGATAQRWTAQEQTDFKFSDTGFWFGKLRYEDDRFSSYFYQGTASTGVGHKFLDSDTTKLSSQIGVGYRTYKTRESLDADGVTVIPPAYKHETIFSGAIDYSHALTETTKLMDKLIVESGATNTFTQNDLAVQVKVTNVLGIALGYSVRYNSEPAVGFKKMDTLSTVNLVYEFK